jgi:hypothetical protein
VDMGHLSPRGEKDQDLVVHVGTQFGEVVG